MSTSEKREEETNEIASVGRILNSVAGFILVTRNIAEFWEEHEID